jgi:hypothetical protein
MARYHRIIVEKIQFIMPKLVPFVRHGNKVHSRYMKEQAEKATCKVPAASDIKGLEWELTPDCAAKGECSIPEH